MIKGEDYKEPACPFCTDFYDTDSNKPAFTVPVARVIEKLDSYFARNDTQGAKRHLLYWLSEAQQGKDLRGELAVRNELLGLYRKTRKRSQAMENAEICCQLIEKLNLTDSITSGTVYLNIATVYEAFGEPQKAVEIYELTAELYRKHLPPDDEKVGGLCNNMALAYVDCGNYDKAMELYNRALGIMKNVKNGYLDAAITYINMAHLIDIMARESGDDASDRIDELMNMAQECLDNENLERNGYYAFVCEKCAPSFGYFGYFIAESEYSERAKKIYEGT